MDHNKKRNFFKFLKKLPAKKIDNLLHPIHDQVFKYTNCLDCANCCSVFRACCCA